MIKINVFNSKTHVDCNAEEYELCQHILSYFVEGSKFSNNAFWDGRIRLLKKNWFPTGLLSRLQLGLKKHEIPFEVTDHRVEPPKHQNKLKINSSIVFRPYQSEVIELSEKQPRGIIVLGTGGGKSILLSGIIFSKSVPTLVITPDTGLREQLYETISFVLGKENVSFDIESDAPIVVSNIQALVRKKPEHFKRFLMLCIDEFHHCFHGDTKVGDAFSGGSIKIKDIHDDFHKPTRLGQKKIRVKTWDGEKWLAGLVTNAFKYPSPKKMLKIKVQDEDGKIKELIVTHNHKFLTDNGKKEIKSFKVGEELILGYKPHCEAMKTRSNNTDYRKHLSDRAKRNNTKRSQEVRKSQSEKIKRKIRDGVYNPYGRGKYGNGGEMTPTQKQVLNIVGGEPEYVVAPKDKQRPHHYKIDVAILDKKIAIEVDGSSHKYRKEKDDKKDARLEALGWKVVRIPESCSEEELLKLKKLILHANTFTT